MVETKDIVFIDPPLIDEKGDVLFVPGHLPHLGIAILASVARRDCGHRTAIIDAVSLNYNVKQVVDEVVSMKPRYIGLTAMTHNITSVAYLCEIFRRLLPEAKIILGGVHITAATETTYKKYPNLFDVCVIGEGEDTIVELLRALDGKRSLDNILGLAWREENGTVRKTARRPDIKNMDQLPFPAWDLLPTMNKLHGYGTTFISAGEGKTNHLMTSRGCPAKCVFCDTSVNGNALRGYSPEYVLEMMEILTKKYGVTDIQINDDTFVSLRKRMIKICDLMIENKMNVSWSCDARVNSVTEEGINKMAEAGCWQIAYGVETGSQRVMDYLKKRITFDQIRTAFALTDKAAIENKGFFILGHPTETPESLEETVKFMLELPMDVVGCTFFTVFPGSPCYEGIEQYGSFNPDLSLTNTYSCSNFIANGFTQEQLIAARRDAMRRFYFRPKYMYRQLKHAGTNPRHLFKLAKGATKAVSKFVLPSH